MLKKAAFTIEGVAPLLMHCGQLADPMNEHARALADAVKVFKKAKTEAAYEAACKAEFIGGLYVDEKLEPCLPGELLEAVIVAGAKKSSQGKEVKAGLIVDGNWPLQYVGPRDPEGLWDAKFYHSASVRVKQSRIIRIRPRFPAWSCTFEVQYNDELLDERDVAKFVAKAGAEVGVGDYRPRYGRFVVVS